VNAMKGLSRCAPADATCAAAGPWHDSQASASLSFRGLFRKIAPILVAANASNCFGWQRMHGSAPPTYPLGVAGWAQLSDEANRKWTQAIKKRRRDFFTAVLSAAFAALAHTRISLERRVWTKQPGYHPDLLFFPDKSVAYGAIPSSMPDCRTYAASTSERRACLIHVGQPDKQIVSVRFFDSISSQ